MFLGFTFSIGAHALVVLVHPLWLSVHVSLSVCVDVFVTSECVHLYILYCISLYPDVPPIGKVINIINSCKVIEANPPL